MAGAQKTQRLMLKFTLRNANVERCPKYGFIILLV